MTVHKNLRSSPAQPMLWDTVQTSPDMVLQSAAHEACKTWPRLKRLDIRAEYYPYVGLKSTVRIKADHVRLRISDILVDAPFAVLYALVQILLSRAYSKPAREEDLLVFNEYSLQAEVEAKHAAVRAQKCRKNLPGPEGRYFNLNEIFKRVNRLYFEGKLAKPVLSWSPHESHRILGYHDSHLNLIVISRILDKKHVPPLVVEFAMYHEALHSVVRAEKKNGKRVVHSSEFRKREKNFPAYQQVMNWIKRRTK